MLLTILVTIDSALSTATLALFLEHRRRECMRDRIEALEELKRRMEAELYGR